MDNSNEIPSMSGLTGPRVSICIPAYNQTIYLEKLFESIKIQTFTNFEVIISDDSSTNDVKNLVDRFDLGGKIKYFRNQPSLGSPANWNAAISRATGTYVKIMHHDDAFATNDALASMVSFIEATRSDYVFCDTKIENVKDPTRNRKHKIKKFGKLIKRPYLLFFGNSIGAPSTLLLKRELSRQVSYDERYIWLVDIEFYIRLLQTSVAAKSIPRQLIITHEAVEQRLTTAILADFGLQIKEAILLYEAVSGRATATARFFMQVLLTRLLLRSGTREKGLMKEFKQVPLLLRIYFSVVKVKPFYFAYSVFMRLLDVARKVFYHG